MSTIFFWILIVIFLYSYIGFMLLLFIINLCKKIFWKKKKRLGLSTYEPEITLFIPSFNEKEITDSKIQNSFALDYPQNKIQHVWVTDGSTDGTPEYLKKYDSIIVFHENERKGKIGAMNRGIKLVKTPIVIFSDANTVLGKNTIREIIKEFEDEQVGCVAGEKRIIGHISDKAVGSGEGIYWQYESILKRLESDIYSTVGAAGELFAIRRELYEEVEPDTILDDFVVSLKIAQKGYKIKYAPKAQAFENSSFNIHEELKRKTRIAAGCIQTLLRMKSLLNPFKYHFLSFEYFSHKVLRWTVIPFLFIIIPLLNFWMISLHHLVIYELMFICECLFYLLVIIGRLLRDHNVRFKIFFIPYYIFFMNYSIIIGIFKYLSGKQSVNWDKARRA